MSPGIGIPWKKCIRKNGKMLTLDSLPYSVKKSMVICFHGRGLPWKRIYLRKFYHILWRMNIPYILPPLSMVKVGGAAESYGDEPTRERAPGKT